MPILQCAFLFEFRHRYITISFIVMVSYSLWSWYDKEGCSIGKCYWRGICILWHYSQS